MHLLCETNRRFLDGIVENYWIARAKILISPTLTQDLFFSHTQKESSMEFL